MNTAIAYNLPSVYDSSSTEPVVVVDWYRYYGDVLYEQLAAEIAFVEKDLKEGGMWHPLFTPSKVVGMIMAVGYTLEELYRLTVDDDRRSTLALEALDVLTAAVPVGATDPTQKGRHPGQMIPVAQVLNGSAAKAIRGMKPVFA
jgi:hypothetical protein